MSQLQQLERILAIDFRIRGGEFPNADGLAQELEVSRRVIFNDRKFLVERLGAPLAHSREKRGWYYTDLTWMIPSTMVSEEELLAFMLGFEVARHSIGKAFESPLSGAVEKIAGSLRGPVGVDLQSLRDHCSFRTSPAIMVEATTIMALRRAIQDCRSVRVTYYSAESNATRARTIDPYHLYHAEGNWYVFAFDHDRGRVLIFHAGRIRTLEVPGQRFQIDDSFDAQQRVREMFGIEAGDELMSVAIRFNDYQAAFIRDRVWHPSQRIEELPDNGLILRFETSSWGEVTRFVLQYGSNAELLEPQDLREEIAQQIRAMHRLYVQEPASCQEKG